MVDTDMDSNQPINDVLSEAISELKSFGSLYQNLEGPKKKCNGCERDN